MKDKEHVLSLINMLRSELPSLRNETKKEKKSYFSNASWTKIKNSQDEHYIKDTSEGNLEYAKAICELLLSRYGVGGIESPCHIRGVCIKTWVTDENGNEVKEGAR